MSFIAAPWNITLNAEDSVRLAADYHSGVAGGFAGAKIDRSRAGEMILPDRDRFDGQRVTG